MDTDIGLGLVDELRKTADEIAKAILSGAPMPVQFVLVVRDQTDRLLLAANHTSDLLAVIRNLTAGAATAASQE